jgi:hypothetical protein
MSSSKKLAGPSGIPDFRTRGPLVGGAAASPSPS